MSSFRAVNLPAYNKEHQFLDAILDGFLSFSGGVILATVFIDVIPHVESIWLKCRKEGVVEIQFPLVYFLLCLGFFLAYLAEEGFEAILSSRKTKNKRTKRGVNVLLAALAFAIAMSIHSFLEGLTMLQNTSNRVTELFLALLLFKVVEMFSHQDNKHSKRDKVISLVATILAFGLMIPLGSAIGAVLDKYGISEEMKDVITLTTESMAAGVFLHIAFIDIIGKQINFGKRNLFTFVFIFIGFSVVTALHWIFGTIRLRAAGGDEEEEYPEYFEDIV